MVKLINIIDAFVELGGKGTLKEIYQAYCELSGDNIDDVKSTIRATIYINSTDSKVHYSSGSKNDIFYKISKKPVIWGLREESIKKADKETVDEYFEFDEGKLALKTHIKRERNPLAIKKAKEKYALEHNGEVFCEICHHNLSEYYGKLGHNFVEVHHLKPVSEMKEGEKTNINDLIMVCPNCHRMIHKLKPLPYSRDEIKKRLFDI